MKVFSIGASRNIGYYASLRLLEAGHEVTFLLRSPVVLQQDPAVQKHVRSGKARLVKGDATVDEDVRRGWIEAGGDEVAFLLFTVGGKPGFSFVKGATINPPDLCTRAIMTALRTMPPSLLPTIRVVAISSTGLTPESHSNLPFYMKHLYKYLLREPHKDKLCMEAALARASGVPFLADTSTPKGLLPNEEDRDKWTEAGASKRVVIIRAAFLTDGVAKGTYRTSEGDHGKKFATISRQDVAHFIVEGLLKDWERWEGKVVSVAY